MERKQNQGGCPVPFFFSVFAFPATEREKEKKVTFTTPHSGRHSLPWLRGAPNPVHLVSRPTRIRIQAQIQWL